MKRVASFITRYCYAIFIVFLLLTALCGFLSTKVKINHDLYSYMPADSETTLGLNIMKDEFSYGETSNWQIMIEDLDSEEREEVRSYLENANNIKSVSYDDSDEHLREKDGHTYALYDVVVNLPADSEEAKKTYDEIYNYLKKRYVFYQAGEMPMSNGSVVSIVLVLGSVGSAMVILFVMSESFIEPILYLFTIMIAVVLNKGTNIIFPSVSHVTDGIAMILQMALSMDYAIMLSSRYKQEKAAPDHPDKRKAMYRALRYSFGAISSSSLTTVVGLLVLILMSYTIGKDMGLVLSKGVAFSLLAIFTVMPALLLLFDKWIEKTKKKVPRIKLNFLGNQEYKLRKLAMPIFVLIFVGAFLLKGSMGILYTTSENNRIKDVFPTVNQTVVVYDNSIEEKVAKLCADFTDAPSVKRVLCYSNTLGEVEKYNEIIPKANDLNKISISGQTARGGGKDIEVEDYLVKVLYYYYYRGDEHKMTLVDFVRFIQKDVLTNERFEDEVDVKTTENFSRLALFILPEEANKPRSKNEIAEILGIPVSSVDDLYTLYLAKHPNNVRMTLYEFASFVNSEILTNPEYAGMISDENQYYLEKLLILSNPSETSVERTAAELAEIFGLEKSDVEMLLLYYNFLSIDEPTVAASPVGMIRYALTNEMIREKLGLTEEEVINILNVVDDVREAIEPYLDKVPGLRDVIELLEKEYTYSDYVNLAYRIEEVCGTLVTKLIEINEEYDLGLDNLIAKVQALDLSLPLGNIKQIYRAYQAFVTTKSLSITEFVNFLISYADAPLVNLDSERLELLSLVKYVIDNQYTYFNADELANAFGLDLKQLRLVYALYDYRYVDGDLWLSLKQVVGFLTDEVFVDADFAGRLSEAQKEEVRQVARLMRAAEAGIMYSYDELYRELSLLSNGIDRNQLFLLYLYHGSLYDYDESWALSIEQFVDFLNERVLPDARFADRIGAEMREDIIEAKTTIADGKRMLVGPEHSRVLFETYLPSEGKETTEFLVGIKDELGEGSKTKYFLAGDSAMAYEMSLTFGDELNFITLITMIAIFIVVALSFKSFLIPLILVLTIQTAVYLNMAYLSLTGQSTLFLAIIIVQSILMGATIDYAILFTSYYLEQRNYFKLGVKDALMASYNKSIHSILTSASILILVTMIVGNFTTAIASKICQSISGGALVSTLIILLLLPAMLATLDRFIVKRK